MEEIFRWTASLTGIFKLFVLFTVGELQEKSKSARANLANEHLAYLELRIAPSE